MNYKKLKNFCTFVGAETLSLVAEGVDEVAFKVPATILTAAADGLQFFGDKGPGALSSWARKHAVDAKASYTACKQQEAEKSPVEQQEAAPQEPPVEAPPVDEPVMGEPVTV